MSLKDIPLSILKPRLGFCVVATILLLCGLVMAFSASTITSISEDHESTSYLLSQGKLAAIGMVVAVLIFLLPLNFWKDFWNGKITWIIWGVCFTLIIATALFGVSHGGAKRWIVLPVLGEVQPGEFIKIGLALVACKIIEDYDKGEIPLKSLIIGLFLFLVFPLGLIYVTQSDLGTTIIIAVCLIAALYYTNKPMKALLIIVAVCAILGLVAVFGSGYRSERMVYLDPWNDGEDGFGSGYQTIHSLYALADGGLFGVGLGNSREKFLYLPANNTDYVFAVVCEELGVVGGMAIVLLFLALLYFGLKISRHCQSSFSRGLSGCLTTMLVFQAFLNIGCAISLFPMTGKPLPFFSVGGSSMIATMIILGFVLACSRASEQETPEAEFTRRRENLRVTTHAPQSQAREQAGRTPRRSQQLPRQQRAQRSGTERAQWSGSEHAQWSGSERPPRQASYQAQRHSGYQSESSSFSRTRERR